MWFPRPTFRALYEVPSSHRPPETNDPQDLKSPKSSSLLRLPETEAPKAEPKSML